jgi:hypothetical protein
MKQLLALIVILAASTATSQTAAVNGYCTTGAMPSIISGLKSSNYLQGVIPQCLVTVYLTGTTNKATIYSNGSGGSLTNPFTANTDASWLFYAATTVGYDIVMSGGIPPNAYVTPVTLTDVLIGGGGGSGGTPGGSNTDVQVNVLGAFGGYSTLTYTPSTGLTVGAPITGYAATFAPLGTMTGNWTGDTTSALTFIDSLTGTGTTNYVWTWNGTTGQWEAGGSSGGVSQILAGTNISISPSGGTGNVTVNAVGGGTYPANANVVAWGNSQLSGDSPCGQNLELTITGGTVTGGVATFTTTNTTYTHNGLTAGCYVTLTGFTGSSVFLNGQQLTVLSTGLSGTQFEANITGLSSGAVGAGGGWDSYLAVGQLGLSALLPSTSTVYGNTAPGDALLDTLITDYTTQVHPLSPAVTGKLGYLFINAGADDVISNSSITTTYIEAGLQNLWALAHADGWVVIAVNLLDLHNNIYQDCANCIIGPVNDWIKGQGPNQGITGISSSDITNPTPCIGCYWDRLVDAHSVLPDVSNTLFYEAGGDHLTPGGNDRLFPLMNAALLLQNTTPLPETDCIANLGYGCVANGNTWAGNQAAPYLIAYTPDTGGAAQSIVLGRSQFATGHGSNNWPGFSVTVSDHTDTNSSVGFQSDFYYDNSAGTELYRVSQRFQANCWTNSTYQAGFATACFTLDPTNSNQVDVGQGGAVGDQSGSMALYSITVGAGGCIGCGASVGTTTCTTAGVYPYSCYRVASDGTIEEWGITATFGSSVNGTVSVSFPYSFTTLATIVPTQSSIYCDGTSGGCGTGVHPFTCSVDQYTSPTTTSGMTLYYDGNGSTIQVGQCGWHVMGK